MQPARYGPLQRRIQQLAASAPGSWLLAHILRGTDHFFLKVSRGRTTLTGILAGVPVIWVTTIGAHSRQPRTRPLLPIHDPDHPGRFAVIATNFGSPHIPAWYYNLKKNPRATCLIDSKAATFTAHEAGSEEYERFWRYATNTYLGYTSYRQRAGRRIPIMVMERDDSASDAAGSV